MPKYIIVWSTVVIVADAVVRSSTVIPKMQSQIKIAIYLNQITF